MTRDWGGTLLRAIRYVGLGLPMLLSVVSGRADEIESRRAELAAKGVEFLKTYCLRCHNHLSKDKTFDILDRDRLVARRGPDDPVYLDPGTPEESHLWERVSNGHPREMPESGAKLTAEEIRTFKRWIEIGAPYPPAKFERPEPTPPPHPPAPTSPAVPPEEMPRPAGADAKAAGKYLGPKEILTAIRDDLRLLDKDDRRFMRYLTLSHLYNLKESGSPKVDSHHLDLARAAVSKVVNSLSWGPDIVVPRVVDAARTVLRIDLRDLDWDESNAWTLLAKSYPFGLQYDQDEDEELREVAKAAGELAGGDLHWIRGDWFVVAATLPGLYEDILKLPKQVVDLERQLGVNVESNFLRNRVARAGFNQSGISKQNRAVERHAAQSGAYWKSYDFLPNEPRGRLADFPLGPEFPANPFASQAFHHGGGEVLFNLPNGLLAYMLFDAQGARIAKGPIELVIDPNKFADGPHVVNALSCISCHVNGMHRFTDTVRDGAAVEGAARQKVDRLYPKAEVMDRLLAKDELRYQEALEKAIGDFLPTRDAKGRPLKLSEPVSAVAQVYLAPLDAASVAFELGMNDPKALVKRIEGSQDLQGLGLKPLTDQDAIARDVWQSREEGAARTLFQRAALLVGAGTPLRVDMN